MGDEDQKYMDSTKAELAEKAKKCRSTNTPFVVTLKPGFPTKQAKARIKDIVREAAIKIRELGLPQHYVLKNEGNNTAILIDGDRDNYRTVSAPIAHEFITKGAQCPGAIKYTGNPSDVQLLKQVTGKGGDSGNAPSMPTAPPMPTAPSMPTAPPSPVIPPPSAPKRRGRPPKNIQPTAPTAIPPTTTNDAGILDGIINSVKLNSRNDEVIISLPHNAQDKVLVDDWEKFLKWMYSLDKKYPSMRYLSIIKPVGNSGSQKFTIYLRPDSTSPFMQRCSRFLMSLINVISGRGRAKFFTIEWNKAADKNFEYWEELENPIVARSADTSADPAIMFGHFDTVHGTNTGVQGTGSNNNNITTSFQDAIKQLGGTATVTTSDSLFARKPGEKEAKDEFIKNVIDSITHNQGTRGNETVFVISPPANKAPVKLEPIEYLNLTDKIANSVISSGDKFVSAIIHPGKRYMMSLDAEYNNSGKTNDRNYVYDQVNSFVTGVIPYSVGSETGYYNVKFGSVNDRALRDVNALIRNELMDKDAADSFRTRALDRGFDAKMASNIASTGGTIDYPDSEAKENARVLSNVLSDRRIIKRSRSNREFIIDISGDDVRGYRVFALEHSRKFFERLVNLTYRESYSYVSVIKAVNGGVEKVTMDGSGVLEKDVFVNFFNAVMPRIQDYKNNLVEMQWEKYDIELLSKLNHLRIGENDNPEEAFKNKAVLDAKTRFSNATNVDTSADKLNAIQNIVDSASLVGPRGDELSFHINAIDPDFRYTYSQVMSFFGNLQKKFEEKMPRYLSFVKDTGKGGLKRIVFNFSPITGIKYHSSIIGSICDAVFPRIKLKGTDDYIILFDEENDRELKKFNQTKKNSRMVVLHDITTDPAIFFDPDLYNKTNTGSGSNTLGLNAPKEGNVATNSLDYGNQLAVIHQTYSYDDNAKEIKFFIPPMPDEGVTVDIGQVYNVHNKLVAVTKEKLPMFVSLVYSAAGTKTVILYGRLDTGMLAGGRTLIFYTIVSSILKPTPPRSKNVVMDFDIIPDRIMKKHGDKIAENVPINANPRDLFDDKFFVGSRFEAPSSSTTSTSAGSSEDALKKAALDVLSAMATKPSNTSVFNAPSASDLPTSNVTSSLPPIPADVQLTIGKDGVNKYIEMGKNNKVKQFKSKEMLQRIKEMQRLPGGSIRDCIKSIGSLFGGMDGEFLSLMKYYIDCYEATGDEKYVGAIGELTKQYGFNETQFDRLHDAAKQLQEIENFLRAINYSFKSSLI